MSVSRRTFLLAGAGAAAAVVAAVLVVQEVTDDPAPRRPPRTPEATTPPSGSWQSALLSVTEDGLEYAAEDGLRLPDFSHAGYHQGERELPDVAVVLTVGPVRGDNTAHLQEAIDAVGAGAPGADGFRGALLLEPGTYEVRGTLRVDRSGVVLRGSGDGDDPASATIIRAVGNRPEERDVVVVGGPRTEWDDEVPGTRTDVVTEVVRVAERTFEVADAGRLAVGDTVVLVRPCTREWLDAIDGGGTGDDEPWEPGSRPVVYERRITAVDGDRVTVDVPVFDTLDRSLAQSYLYVRREEGLVTEVGVEDLRVDIAAGGEDDEDHARNAVRLESCRDAWVRRCTFLHFVQAGVVTRSTTQASVVACRALDPVAQITGGRRYNFNLEPRSQQILVTGCHAGGARHAFVSNGHSTVSGVVFHRTTAEGSHTASEGHRQWTQGLLFDNHREVSPRTDVAVALYNRGDYGTGHGWSAVNSVAWNTDTDGSKLVVQRPPTAQNYAIGCSGEVIGEGPFEARPGYIEGTDRPGLFPESLYEAQLADRLRG